LKRFTFEWRCNVKSLRFAGLSIPVRFLSKPAGPDFATEDGMPTREIFVVLFIALYIGWIAVAAVRSNRRHNSDATKDPVHHA